MRRNFGVTMVTLTISPQAWKQAKIASINANKYLRDWIAEAIEEKDQREKEDRIKLEEAINESKHP